MEEDLNVRRGSLDDLTPDDRNMNKHTSYGMSLIEKSIRKHKFGRSILVDKNDRIIGGNGVTETAASIGATKTIVVETTGDELVVVKRTDIDLDSKEGREMALADNATAVADIEWDATAVKEIEGEFEIEPEDWGVVLKETELLSKVEFTDVYYEPKEKPDLNLADCIDMSLYEKKMEAIDSMGLPKDVRDTMELLARRFIKIDFQRVADYYAFNANDREKDAIERLRLVLVDGAIDGFIEDGLLRVANYFDTDEGGGRLSNAILARRISKWLFAIYTYRVTTDQRN